MNVNTLQNGSQVSDTSGPSTKTPTGAVTVTVTAAAGSEPNTTV